MRTPLSAGPALWHDNDFPALQMPPCCALKRGASRLITMTKGTLERGLTLDTAGEMTGMAFSSQMETGGFDVPKRRQMDGVTASLSKLLGSPLLPFSSQAGSPLLLLNRALSGQAFRPHALPGSHRLCLSV